MNIPGSKVVVIDDDPSVRKAIARLLQASGLEVTPHASAEEFLSAYNPEIPGCIVLDLAMPGLTGLALQDALASYSYAPPIIFLTGNATINDSVKALKHGAIEFLTKPVDEAVLLNAVHNAIEKDKSDRQKRSEVTRISANLATITPREVEVLSHVISGKLNKQIADELGTVEKTIKVHRARVMEKMQVHSLAELVMHALKVGVHPTAYR